MPPNERHYLYRSPDSTSHTANDDEAIDGGSVCSATMPSSTLWIDVHRDTAAEFIDLGCDLLALRRPGAAVGALRHAVDLLSRSPTDVRTDHRDLEIFLKAYCVERDATAVVRADEERRRRSPPVTTAGAGLGGAPSILSVGHESKMDGVAIYDHPVRLRGGRIVLEEVSAIALYNLGLAHHLLSKQGKSPSSCIASIAERKALAFYEMSESVLFLLVKNQCPEDQARCDDVVMALVPPLLNNMGHICLEGRVTRDHHRGRERFDTLLRFIDQYPEQGGVSGTLVDEIILVNAMIASQMNGAQAA